MDRFTALINDNMIAARYGVFATIAMLTAYGISNTPLFFRYRSVAEIPKSLFVGRRRLYCRVIGVHRDATSTAANNSIDGPIQITVRHLSPIGMLLPTSWFESLMRINPTSGGGFAPGSAPQSSGGSTGNRGLLGLRVAGVSSPPVSRDSHDPLRFLEGLARNRTMVSCQLLGREIRKPLGESMTDRRSYAGDIAGTSTSTGTGNHEEDSSVLEGQQVALCKIRYRPHFFQLFPTDIAGALVRSGTASAAPDLLCHSPPAGVERRENAKNDIVTSAAFQTEIVDASQRIQDMRNDVEYLDNLAMLEFEAAQKSAGMWSVPEVRQLRKDLVDEVDFQAKASLFQKIWRRIRGG
mmetsp:Transcript_13318/g.31125  ORF Transcript_13318/g.31125 Transcript_13318/m.31125 type:complete len:352 (-) Transcript_13318:742-1797(-)